MAEQVTNALSVPTVGIGAGPGCNGQLLILHDLLGLNEDFNPRFLKRFGQLGEEVRAAVGRYAKEVRAGAYPGEEHVHGC